MALKNWADIWGDIWGDIWAVEGEEPEEEDIPRRFRFSARGSRATLHRDKKIRIGLERGTEL
jgi:hypothetical protein